MVRSVVPLAEQEPAELRTASIKELQSNLRKLECSLRFDVLKAEGISTGVAALDSILPDQRLRCGTLSEWIAAETGSGAESLAVRVASQAQRRGTLIVLDRERRFYAPAFESMGVKLETTIFIRPESRADELWAAEQSLRCSGVGAVLFRIDKLKAQEFRRLQLAAEQGTAVGLLLRSMFAGKQTGWADVRLLVSSRPSSARSFRRRLSVRCAYAKGALSDRTVELEICDQTGALQSVDSESP